jgi:hypothetical protein
MHANGFTIPHFVFDTHDDIAPISAKLGYEKAQSLEIPSRADCCAASQSWADNLAGVIQSRSERR